MVLRLRITEPDGASVHAVALRCQIRIEPQRRSYSETEAELLVNLFGARSRWADTLKPMQLSTVSVLVPSFTGSTEVDVPVACSYDLEVATGSYFHALTGSDVPLLLLFSGTVFGKGSRGFWVEQVPWHAEAACALPVAVWRAAMNVHFPDSGWIRLRRDTIDELLRYKSAHAIATWDDTVGALMSGERKVGSR